jgi:hypothetical protein
MAKSFTRRAIVSFALLVFCTSTANARIYEYDVPEKMTIAFSGNSYKKYLNLLDGADTSDTINIGDEFKKSLKIFGTYRDAQGEERLFSGRARITGDLKDHLEPGRRISSLSITLKEGNIGGVVKFRLLIPDTRQSENEIFWSLLMEQLGYPVPFRRMVNVNLMGENHEFIFEEKPEKEFLESNGFREGPILEFDERQLWSNFLLTRSWGRWLDQLKIKNSDFLKNKVAYEIAYRSLNPKFERNKFFDLYDHVNKKYASHGVTAHNRKYLYDVIYNDYLPIYFDGDVFRDQENLCGELPGIERSKGTMAKIESTLKVLEAKFRDRTRGAQFSESFGCVARVVLGYFDFVRIKFDQVRPLKPVEEVLDSDLSSAVLRRKGLRFRPPTYNYDLARGTGTECFYIYPAGRDYVDRHPDLLAAYESGDRTQSKEEWGESHYRRHGSEERRQFFDSAVDNMLFEHYVDRYPDLLAAYESSAGGSSEKASWGRSHFFRLDGFKLGRNIYGEGDEQSVIEGIEDMIERNEPPSVWGNCEPLSLKKLKKVFSGEEKPLQMNGIPYYGFMNLNYAPKVDEFFREIDLVESSIKIEVPSGITYIKLSADQTKIDVRLLSDDSYLVFHNSKISNSEIEVVGLGQDGAPQPVRYNTKLLTSCVTFIDSAVHKSVVRSNYCSREDAINFIRVDGIAVDLEIKNAANDGFDADFSHVQFNSVRVDHAGNDCIDLSAGVYNLSSLVLKNCGDKGVSAGEKSFVSLRDIEISGAEMGIASKDLSKVFMTGKTLITKTNQCLSAYQKKQEFGPGSIVADKRPVSCDFVTPNRGVFEIGRSCRFVDRSYFFDLCANPQQLEVIINQDLPRDHSLLLEQKGPNDGEWRQASLTERSKSTLAECRRQGSCVVPLGEDQKPVAYRISLHDRLSGLRYDVREFN